MLGLAWGSLHCPCLAPLLEPVHQDGLPCSLSMSLAGLVQSDNMIDALENQNFAGTTSWTWACAMQVIQQLGLRQDPASGRWILDAPQPLPAGAPPVAAARNPFLPGNLQTLPFLPRTLQVSRIMSLENDGRIFLQDNCKAFTPELLQIKLEMEGHNERRPT